MKSRLILLILFSGNFCLFAAPPELPAEARSGLRRAVDYFRKEVAVRGGYVYFVDKALERRWGEGVATPSQIWVQPPGTPTVGMAYVRAYDATGDPYYRDAVAETAAALRYGQLESGGWIHAIDFDPKGKRAGHYRNGKSKGRNYSSLDDDVTQAALRFLIHADRVHDFKNEPIHEAVTVGLEALLKAQFPNGGFPQVWTGPVEARPLLKASYPDYDWRKERRVKEYWYHYTLNDNLAGDVAKTFTLAHQVYQNPRSLAALRRLGDFLIAAQMPAPQRAWCQQYHPDMKPAWARKFEPPAIVTSESQDVISALMQISRATKDARYLRPIPAALDYLESCQLADGRLPRYLELRSNKPLYMYREGKLYHLTYSDDDLPSHYAFKIGSRVATLRKQFRAVRESAESAGPSASTREKRAQAVLAKLDRSGRWLSVSADKAPSGGQPKIAPGEAFLSSAVFAKNVGYLCDYLEGLR